MAVQVLFQVSGRQLGAPYVSSSKRSSRSRQGAASAVVNAVHVVPLSQVAFCGGSE